MIDYIFCELPTQRGLLAEIIGSDLHAAKMTKATLSASHEAAILIAWPHRNRNGVPVPWVRIDLLVTNVGLPGGISSRQMADAAKVSRPGLKVLFITSYAEKAAPNHGHLAPSMEVLVKPFAMEALASRIRGLIENRS